MQNLRTICRALLFFVGFSFLFGQLFSADFNIPATLAGLGGFSVAVLTGDRNFESGKNFSYILASGVICLIGIALDALSYSMSNPSSGNYYAWFLIGPYAVAAAFLMQQFGVRAVNVDSRDGGG